MAACKIAFHLVEGEAAGRIFMAFLDRYSGVVRLAARCIDAGLAACRRQRAGASGWLIEKS
jgi:hypothetical protein